MAPERELVAASRLFLGEIESCIQRGEDFAFETTLAGRGYLRQVRRLRAEQWRTELIYLALPSREMSRLRVAERVAHGGHTIPIEQQGEQRNVVHATHYQHLLQEAKS